MSRLPKPTLAPTLPIVTKPLAVQLLDKAGEHMTQRVAQYDAPQGERSMGRCVAAFNIITGHTLSEAEGWLLLQILKDVRQWQTPDKPHRDSIEDCVAYSALKGEALFKQEML
jgi:hypothetical protein